jgi:CheY-like chemotaxis protein
VSIAQALLLDAFENLAFARNLAAVQAILRTTARALLCADGATLVLRDGDRVFYADEDLAPLCKERHYPIERCVSGWCMLQRRPIAILDLFSDERVPPDVYEPAFASSLAMAPIGATEPIGALGVYWAAMHHTDERELDLLQRLADAAAAAIERIRLVDDAAAGGTVIAMPRRRRVLVVDDDEDVAESVADLLRVLGHDVATAPDGPHALDVAARFRPEIAILDIALPVMDGYELAEQLASTGDAPFLIALSGYGQQQNRERGHAAGFSAYLVKPFTTETLIRIFDAVSG